MKNSMLHLNLPVIENTLTGYTLCYSTELNVWTILEGGVIVWICSDYTLTEKRIQKLILEKKRALNLYHRSQRKAKA